MSRKISWFIGLVSVAALILALRALGIMSDENSIVYRLAEAGWGQSAGVIVANKVKALWHAALMTVCVVLFIWLFCQSRVRNRRLIAGAKWLLVLIVAGDAFFLSRHYVKTMPISALAENDVVRILKSVMPEKRIALLSQEGFYNNWLTFLFPYHNIQSVNFTQMPRMPADYKKFLGAVGYPSVRFWQLSAVGLVLAPAQAWVQFQNDPAMKNVFDLVYAYNVRPNGVAVDVLPATREQPGQHAVLRLRLPSPRFALINKWETADDRTVLQRLASTNYPLFEKVMLATEFGEKCAGNVQNSSGAPEHGEVQLLGYKAGKISLRTSSVSPCILRVSEKYDPDWHAWVDGQKTEVLRVDFIFQGVYLSPGMHEVTLRYSPPVWPLYVQGAGFLVVITAGLALLFRRRSK